MLAELRINGNVHQLEFDEDTPLLWVLRDEAKLKGTKFGCGIGQCGACTVHLDGKPLRSCIRPAASIADAEVTTIEGLDGREAAAVQRAWVDLQVPQWRYCQSGQVMSATALLKRIPNPSDRDIDLGMNGNLCRCVTYHRIRAAIHHAADLLRASA